MSDRSPTPASTDLPGPRSINDRGQSAPLLVAAVALAGLLAVATAHTGVALIDHQRARTAADAAALAGAVDGRMAAARVAAANGARIVSYADDGDVVVVQVAIGRAVVTARATAGMPRGAPSHVARFSMLGP